MISPDCLKMVADVSADGNMWHCCAVAGRLSCACWGARDEAPAAFMTRKIRKKCCQTLVERRSDFCRVYDKSNRVLCNVASTTTISGTLVYQICRQTHPQRQQIALQERQPKTQLVRRQHLLPPGCPIAQLTQSWSVFQELSTKIQHTGHQHTGSGYTKGGGTMATAVPTFKKKG